MNWIRGKKIENQNSLNEIESTWDIKFPDLFKEIISENNQSYPEYKVFQTSKSRERVFGEFLDFDFDHQNNALKRHEWISDILPERTFPFAVDPAGNFICFDYRSNIKTPKVIFWNHEGTVVNGKEIFETEDVANSFEEFIGKLYIPK